MGQARSTIRNLIGGGRGGEKEMVHGATPTPEEYLREHAARLRAYARHTDPKASERLMESARFLEWQADRTRGRSIAEAKLGKRRQ
jgi:hypothetical protein